MDQQPKPLNIRKAKARQIAVQGLYNILLLSKQPEEMDVFLSGLIDSASKTKKIQIDRKHAKLLLDGVLFRRDDLEKLIDANLKEKRNMSPLVQAILLAGAFELLVMEETPVKVVISEYLSVTDLYFENPERPFIHGMLDAIARSARLGHG